jgi:hypothetical protein
MKAISTANYTIDRYYKGVVAAVQTLIELRILRLYAHDLKLRESITVYQHRGRRLRFSKTHEPRVEEAYSRHFLLLHHFESRSFSDCLVEHGPAESCGPGARPDSTRN